MTVPSPEKVGLLRWMAMLAGASLFVSDYMLDAWAKAPPEYAYWIVGAVAVGVDIKSLREVLLKFLNTWASGGKDVSK